MFKNITLRNRKLVTFLMEIISSKEARTTACENWGWFQAPKPETVCLVLYEFGVHVELDVKANLGLQA